MKKEKRGFNLFLVIFVFLMILIFPHEARCNSLLTGVNTNLSLKVEDGDLNNRGAKVGIVFSKFSLDTDRISKSIEKIKNPDREYDTWMKDLLYKFFTGSGLRIMVFFCVLMIIFFLFRTRNLVMVMIFYILGNIIMFFGHFIARYLIK